MADHHEVINRLVRERDDAVDKAREATRRAEEAERKAAQLQGAADRAEKAGVELAVSRRSLRDARHALGVMERQRDQERAAKESLQKALEDSSMDAEVQIVNLRAALRTLHEQSAEVARYKDGLVKRVEELEDELGGVRDLELAMKNYIQAFKALRIRLED